MSGPRLERIADASAWRGSELDASEWSFALRPEELHELDAALTRVNANGLALEEITAAAFPLPHLSARLAEWLEALQNGRGFVLVQDFPVERYSEHDVRRMYWGFSRHLGEPISQNSYGDLLGDIWDERTKPEPGTFRRIYGSTRGLPFHNDRADLVGLLCLQPAPKGGLSSIVSATAIYNEVLANHPEFLPALYDGFVYVNSEDGGDGSQWRMPMYGAADGFVSCRMGRGHVNRARAAGLPYTELECAALDYIDSLTARPDMRLDMAFRKGDIQLLNNYVTLHSRTEYADDPGAEGRRHLLRVWLTASRRRPIGIFADEFNGVPKTLARV